MAQVSLKRKRSAEKGKLPRSIFYAHLLSMSAAFAVQFIWNEVQTPI